MTYAERSAELSLAASIAVLVLADDQFTDIEMLPVAPRQFSDYEIAQLRSRWGGRGLRSIGVIGLVGTTPECAFKAPLPLKVVTALAEAFRDYLHVLLCDSFEAQKTDVEARELARWFSLEDPRET